MSELSQIIRAIDQGDPQAASQLLPLVYDELRRLAAVRLSQEKVGHSLEPTALVHEAYLRLVEGDPDYPWSGRGHFFVAAAEAMRRILIEDARRKRRPKHGGDRTRLPLDEADLAQEEDERLLALDEGLRELAKEDPILAEVVKLRYFVGLTIEQTAEALKVSVRTANRHWAYARAWLFERLSDSIDDVGPTQAE